MNAHLKPNPEPEVSDLNIRQQNLQAAQANAVNSSQSLVQKLVDVMAAVDHIDKQGTAPAEAGGYSYMYAKDIAHAFRREFVARGILCMGSVVHQERWQDVTKGGKPVQGIDVTMRFTFYDAQSGQELSIDAVGSGLGGDKAAYKAQTGALKYALRSAFLVPDAAADAEAEEPTADAVEYVKAPQRVQLDTFNQQADDDNQWAGEETQYAPPTTTAPHRTPQAPFKPRQQQQGKKYGPPKNPQERISDAQRGRLFAISKSAGLTDDDVHDIIAPFGFTSTNEVTKGTYDKICAIVESGGIR